MISKIKEFIYGKPLSLEQKKDLVKRFKESVPGEMVEVDEMELKFIGSPEWLKLETQYDLDKSK